MIRSQAILGCFMWRALNYKYTIFISVYKYLHNFLFVSRSKSCLTPNIHLTNTKGLTNLTSLYHNESSRLIFINEDASKLYESTKEVSTNTLQLSTPFKTCKKYYKPSTSYQLLVHSFKCKPTALVYKCHYYKALLILFNLPQSCVPPSSTSYKTHFNCKPNFKRYSLLPIRQAAAFPNRRTPSQLTTDFLFYLLKSKKNSSGQTDNQHLKGFRLYSVCRCVNIKY